MLAFNAYSEGWALYAEQLADELGVYDDFEVGRLGYLQLDRLPRLPAGGRHRPPRQALDAASRRVDFFVDDQRLEPEEVASEVDRYCSWPGQACGYKIGHSEIVRQRDRAKAALGARYRPARRSTTRWSRAATSRSTCLARNVDDLISRSRA